MIEETPLPPHHGNTGREPAHKRLKWGTQHKQVRKPWNDGFPRELHLCESVRVLLRDLKKRV